MTRPPIALITGAALRIGQALALDLATHGWKVGLHCRRSTSQAFDLVEKISALGGEAAVLPADLTDAAAPAHLLDACISALGVPTLLINNAAMFVGDEVATLDPALWDAQLAVNLRAPVFLAKAFAAQLPAGASGNVINIIDQRVWKPTPRYFSYTASKLALWGATRTLAQALAPRIRVNAIGPGPVLRNSHQTEEEFRAQCAATILGRGTTPEEIAAAVRFILDAPAMTGQMIALDGGQHLAWQTPDIDGSGSSSAPRKS
jgi:NAD(P)-dependent dehydrogenase (short-subunit alcohol dehydrogenase family)